MSQGAKEPRSQGAKEHPSFPLPGDVVEGGVGPDEASGVDQGPSVTLQLAVVVGTVEHTLHLLDSGHWAVYENTF